MSQLRFAGIQLAFPRPFRSWEWLTGFERAERIAAFRIGVGLVLLWDVLFTYLPQASTFFGKGSLGSPEVFAVIMQRSMRPPFLRALEDPAHFRLILIGWAAAALCLMLGVLPRLAAVFCWLCSVSIIAVNPYLSNSGDNARSIALFYLMLSPCGAVWTLPRWFRKGPREEVFVPAWPVRLLLVQLSAIYFVNGVYKLTGSEWQSGLIMHYVSGNLAWTRYSYAQFPIPHLLLQFMTWTVLVWEVGFPFLVMMPGTRKPTLWLGVCFHLGTAIMLQLGAFPFYMLCYYLPLVPWERWFNSGRT